MQATIAVQPHEPPRHELALEAKRIRMVDLTTTRPQVKRAAPFASHEGGQIEAASATPLNALVPPSTDGMGKLYCQLIKIYAIAPVLLAECTHWH
jgi:hypothetical protein